MCTYIFQEDGIRIGMSGMRGITKTGAKITLHVGFLVGAEKPWLVPLSPTSHVPAETNTEKEHTHRFGATF